MQLCSRLFLYSYLISSIEPIVTSAERLLSSISLPLFISSMQVQPFLPPFSSFLLRVIWLTSAKLLQRPSSHPPIKLVIHLVAI